ncbi:hypothetical protein [Deinococcus cellulosilyticus]|uniref:Yip1 domain-containing protein n=1 Tax=Deinococcus cellulosilyticus (strain DSM 18568 / NBRC 106333 / KACC 11606 / 5516J-15) TaxID=1223518 RepID=A0A511N9T1_DEIC1|nr:hypothetical protein [Deinococcus cellulosilyticus]GEM49589.1 hypothetical protein DC3_52240 [Deinococcus cellulosilyticus NBRC 106333 = KACC 11606]
MATLTEMFSQSVQVIRVPTETNFNRFEDEGNFASAMVFMGGAMLAFTAAGFYFSGSTGAVQHLLIALVYYFGFWGLAFLLGRPMGGEATWHELAYTHALFMAPMLLGFTISSVAFFSFGYLQVASMYLTFVFLGISLYYSVRCIQGTMNFYDPVKVLALIAGLLITSVVVYQLYV